MECQYCGKEIPEVRYDTFGRKVTRKTKYCCKEHRNKDYYEKHKDKFKEYRERYYRDHPEKFNIKKKKGE